jgi:hypothetical protein
MRAFGHAAGTHHVTVGQLLSAGSVGLPAFSQPRMPAGMMYTLA